MMKQPSKMVCDICHKPADSLKGGLSGSMACKNCYVSTEDSKDFASEFGYEEDSRKGEKIYERSLKQGEKLHSIFNDQDIEKIREALEI